MGVVTLPAEGEQTAPEQEVVAQAERSTEALFRWSIYVDVGEGADVCEKRLGGCEDQKHFHAWVCLPNSFQIDDIREKSRAAKARKIKALKDAGDPATGREPSDSFVVLEGQLEEMAEGDMKAVHPEIADRNVQRDFSLIVAELYERPEFEDYEQDLEELRRLGSVPDDERPEGVYEQLQESVLAFSAAFDLEIKERKAREIATLERLSDADVIDIVRKDRIKQAGEDAFIACYYLWMTFIGTRVPDASLFPQTRSFEKVQQLRGAAPQVALALRKAIRELEDAFNKKAGGSGNS